MVDTTQSGLGPPISINDEVHSNRCIIGQSDSGNAVIEALPSQDCRVWQADN